MQQERHIIQKVSSAVSVNHSAASVTRTASEMSVDTGRTNEAVLNERALCTHKHTVSRTLCVHRGRMPSKWPHTVPSHPRYDPCFSKLLAAAISARVSGADVIAVRLARSRPYASATETTFVFLGVGLLNGAGEFMDGSGMKILGFK